MVTARLIVDLLLLFFICFSFGHLVLRTVCDQNKSLSLVYFSPAVGLALWVMLSTYLVRYTGILFPGFVPLVYLVFAITLVFHYRYSGITPALWAIFALFSTLAALPAFMSIPRFGLYSPYGGDPIFYINVAEHATHTLFYNPIPLPNETPYFFPSIGLTSGWQQTDSKLGSLFLISVFQKIAGIKWAYQAYPLLVGLGMAVSASAVVGAIQLATKKRFFWIPLFVGLAIAVTPNGFNWAALTGFYPQTIGMPILLTLFSLLWVFCLSNNQGIIADSPQPKEIGILSLLLASILCSYPDALLPFFTSVALFTVYYLFRIPKPRSVLIEIKKISIIFIILMIGVLILAFHEIHTLLSSANYMLIQLAHGNLRTLSQVGSPNTWRLWEYIALAFGFRPWDEEFLYRDFGTNFIWLKLLSKSAKLLTIAVTGLISYALVFKSYRRYSLALPFLFILLILGVALIWFRYYAPSPWPGIGIGHSFMQLRTATWAAIFCFVLTGAALVLIAGDRPWLHGVLGAILLSWISAGYYHDYHLAETTILRLQQETYGQGFDGLVHIKELLKPIPVTEPVFIDIPANTSFHVWLKYVLRDRMIVGAWMGPRLDSFLCFTKWHLHANEHPSAGAIHVFGPIVIERYVPGECDIVKAKEKIAGPIEIY